MIERTFGIIVTDWNSDDTCFHYLTVGDEVEILRLHNKKHYEVSRLCDNKTQIIRCIDVEVTHSTHTTTNSKHLPEGI